MAKKILIVEDDPGSRRLTEFTLKREGYEVLTAGNGLEGLNRINRDHPDLVVLDVMLPGIDGYEIARRIRSQPETEKLLILMLSGKVRAEDKTTGLQVGANDYLSKPASPALIVQKVAALLGDGVTD
jgi:two-component system, OmpR family, alkaline phosphatase synthesis response regulator PhoP